MKNLLSGLAFTCLTLILGCGPSAEERVPSVIFGHTENGDPVRLFTLTNANGLTAEIMNYGGTVVRLYVPDQDGQFDDIVLGFDKLEDYFERSPYFGSLIGRYANRIANGSFELNGEIFQLALNDEPGGQPCSLHGGERGFDKVLWDAEPVYGAYGNGLKLSYISPDGEEGYPGTLQVDVYYWMTDDNALRIEYEAWTDRATPVNLTQHNYYNLAGESSGSINDHYLTLHASHYTPVDAGLIPTGEIAPVAGTPFDFSQARRMGERVDAEHEQLQFGQGYDHNWVLDKDGSDLTLAAEVYETGSGRVMEVWTTEPGLQFYGGNFLDGTLPSKSGGTYRHRSGFCLEAQHFPDSPNQPDFPSTILRPGEMYSQVTEYRFKLRSD
ncbi:MAG: galactose mutarotase [Opitutales bacterium]|nr:galactose mutarotase [Opitutales bacterium]